MRRDGQTDITKLIGALRDCAKALKRESEKKENAISVPPNYKKCTGEIKANSFLSTP
jgi:hypothetical protein